MSLRSGNCRAQREYISSQTGSGLDSLEVVRRECKLPSPCTPRGQRITDCVTSQCRGLQSVALGIKVVVSTASAGSAMKYMRGRNITW